MKRQAIKTALLLVSALVSLSTAAVAQVPPGEASGVVQGITGPDFNLTAKAGHIMLGDGNSLLAWGFADDDATAGTIPAGRMQYPGPTLILQEDVEVTITLSNELAEPVSIVFPGQTGVVATGGQAGTLTREAPPAGSVTYTFTPTEPGTYLYQSGSNPEIQIEMGMVGAIIVRPTGFSAGNMTAYGTAASAYDREFLFFLSDMDRKAHEEFDGGIPIDPAGYAATLWFINGRNAPDTLHADYAGWLPAQPYGSLATGKPQDRVLMRLVGGGRDLHPFHHHGNNAWMVAQDGRVLESADGANAAYPDYTDVVDGAPGDWLPNGATLPDQSVSNYTITVVPGGTYDAIFTWTGRALNWDIYGDRDGHSGPSCNNGTRLPYEDPGSHCKDITQLGGIDFTLPEDQAMTFGGFWTGSPFLGGEDGLPPMEGGLNPNAGFSFMWHSHTERELTNDDVFPGGMMTMFIVEPIPTP